MMVRKVGDPPSVIDLLLEALEAEVQAREALATSDNTRAEVLHIKSGLDFDKAVDLYIKSG